ncbi:MAG: lytic transglycosylase domain-containing protein, partial [Treponemataceae bacterium]|nr:lytic transglycosylase domain-containing protein [Treponemataceae bacterium]
MKKGSSFPLLFIFFLIGSLETGATQNLIETLQEIENQEIQILLRPIRGNGPFMEEERLFSPNGIPFSWHGKEEPLLTIQEGLDHPLTKRYLTSYTSREGKKWLITVFRRSEPYLAFIRREIEKRQLPLELVFVPVIESAYSPRAVSRSGAVGLWQFMKNSSIYFDMKTTPWIDERRDFWKATVGALEKLRENYGYFKDWPLALAAYNAGVGAIQRALARSGAKTYWELIEKKAISTETAHYVPKFLAVAEILSHPGRYGLEPWWPEVIEWERVPVGRMVDITFLAEKAGIEAQWLQVGNQELTHGVTPADPHYQLKVPRMHVTAVQSVLSQKDLVLVRYYYYTIRSGDTLSALSRH